MMNHQIGPKNHENSWLWLAKIVAGLLIIILLGIHLVVNHLVAPGGLLSYQDIIQYYQNPIIPIMEVFFLIFVVTHALLGVRSIILDLNPSDKTLFRINRLLVAIGSIAIVYGIWLVIVIVKRG